MTAPETTTVEAPFKVPPPFVKPKGYRKPVITPEQYAMPRIRHERPPEILDWIAKAKPCIDSKERGTIPFKPWPAQMAVLHKFMEGCIGIIKKGRQIGMTTTLEIANAYALLWMEPFHGHFVSATDDKMMRMMWETRLALKTADLPAGQRERLVLGTDKSTVISYETPWAASYIHGHAPIPRLHGYPGNSVIMDEVALMPYVEAIHSGFAGMLSDGWRTLWLVSTPQSEGPGHQFFQNFFDHAAMPSSGVFSLRVDWRANPNRDEKWLIDQLPMFGWREDLRDEAHCCLDIMPRDMAFDPERMMQYAKPVDYLGQQATPGHNYSLGVDQSSAGECETVGCIIDLSVRPCQVTALRTFRMNAQNEEGRTLQKAQWIDELGAEFPGHILIDSTNEVGTAETVRLRQKIAVRIHGQVQVTEKVEDGIRRLGWPRSKLIENAVKLTDTGVVVVHPGKFPELYEAFKTARKWIPGQTRKASGKNVDQLDAFLLSCIPLTGRGMGVQNDAGGRMTTKPRGGHGGLKNLRSGRQGQWISRQRSPHR